MRLFTRKNIFYAIKKSMILWTLIFVMLFTSFGFLLSFILQKQVSAYPYKLTIVIDAGHGNPDGGSVGATTGITESELNLVYANKLEKLFQSFGINTVMTRSSLSGLGNESSENYKKEDMQKRKEIIDKSNALAVISIHMNKYTLKSENGAQVFYNEENEGSQYLANNIKNELTRQIDNARELILCGNYFILKCSNIPSVIVECGFLSNESEEVKLQQDEYQDKLCYSIFCGIIKYLMNTQNSSSIFNNSQFV